jgi:flagellar basal body rod protein FlgG
MIFLCLIFISCNDNNELLNEYKLLYTDLENLYTYGYKSYYSPESNKAIPVINSEQGALLNTGVYSDFAILEDGFFKIKLLSMVGYTRNGQFNITFNVHGHCELVTIDGFSLVEPIIFPDLFLPETLTINSDGYVFVSIPKNNKELLEVEIGKINIYKAPVELLEHYKNGIYILKETTDNETIIEGRILNKFLESSNYNLLAVLLRMYYILTKLDNKLIVNIEFKKELTKSVIDYIINTEKYTIEEHNQRKWLMETTFVPHLRYDY